jgi:hypothetical protein
VQSVPPNHISSGGMAGWNEGGFFEGEEGKHEYTPLEASFYPTSYLIPTP